MWIVQTQTDGETWDDVGEYADENEAIRLRREIEHEANGHGVESRVIPKSEKDKKERKAD